VLEQFEGEEGHGVPASPSAPSGKGGGAGAKPGAGAAGGQIPSEAISPAPLPDTPLPSEASGEPASATEDQSSTAGAIVLGLLAGCVLFALGLAVRKGWMRWRYGL
jgi:hypothetical protein